MVIKIRPFGPSMRIFRLLEGPADARNQWFRADPLRRVHAHLSAQGVRLAEVHFSDLQQLFGPADSLRSPRVVTWSGRIRTPDGVDLSIAVGGGRAASGAGASRMHVLFGVHAPGQPAVTYYAQRPEQPLAYMFHPAGESEATVFQDVSPEEGHALVAILNTLGPRHLPIPPRLPLTSQDLRTAPQRRRLQLHDANRRFAQEFRKSLLDWFQENARRP